MKRVIIFCCLVITAFACENSETEAGVYLEGEIQLKHGEVIYSNNKKASLEIININDSRCPSDVVCFWAGDARVTFEFKNNTTSMFELYISGKDTVDGYIFELVSVDPYPVSTEVLELDDYIITLNVTEL